MTTRRPTRFIPLGLTLSAVGALRGTTEISLVDAQGQPVNIYLIMGPNGAGKTTLLEALYHAHRMLDAREHDAFGWELLDQGSGGIQFDALVALDDGIRSELYVLSIVAGDTGLLKRWTSEALEGLGVVRQIGLVYARRPDGSVERSNASDPEAVDFADAVLERQGEPPASLFDSANGYPTLLYFPSDRGIRRPPAGERAITPPRGLNYRAAHHFGLDGETWSASLDNLFVWFAWLADGREERCRDLVNRLVFRRNKRLGAVNRQTLSVPVEVEEATHRLDQLSSGERQFVQLVVRIASHMTGSTLVLIDETEQHLHLTMRRRLVNLIKTWAAEHDGLRFVATSHQADSMRLLAPKLPEPRLVKNGCLVKPRFTPPHDR
jgi:ABC-type lipoprotein export system ATPase subunit